MPDYIILRDSRLGGNLVARCPVINAGPATTLSAIFNSIKTARGGSGRIDTLFILCHGYAGTNDRARVCMDAGGMGLQLGAAYKRVALGGDCGHLPEYCGLCLRRSQYGGGQRRFRRRRQIPHGSAGYPPATVYAADRIRWYDPAEMDFGDWEGNLWAFTASGAPATVARSAPTEISALL